MGRVQRVSDLLPTDLTTNNITTNNLTTNNLTTNSSETKKLQKNMLLIDSCYKEQKRFSKRNRRGYTSNLAKSKARYLSEKLGDVENFMFYLKCAWNLTDAYLDRLLAISQIKAGNKAKQYFAVAAKREMEENG